MWQKNMIFLTYEFVFSAFFFFLLYYICTSPLIRLYLLLLAGVGFLCMYGGLTSLAVVLFMLVIVYFAGRSDTGIWKDIAISCCGLLLIFFKYTSFLIDSLLSWAFPVFAASTHATLTAVMPAAIPLGISFFTFEFIHYLVDVRKGHPPITRASDFLAFGLFWPTMVAGPIKRYEQFIPALRRGLARPVPDDLMYGLARVAIGLAKKWAADNLTGWIIYFEPQFAGASIWMRWVFVLAISTRIVLDFSGYSDIAIGFARMLGIKVLENFNWPYLARSLGEFWQRWHMSLSSWIRDYIYIPLGGNRMGPGRRVANGLIAMSLCGLWHGPSWNFAAWGVYHGIGLAVGSVLGKRRPFLRPERSPSGFLVRRIVGHVHDVVSWSLTLVFVGIGWLLFFYPIGRATEMAAQLIGL